MSRELNEYGEDRSWEAQAYCLGLHTTTYGNTCIYRQGGNLGQQYTKTK